MTKEIYRSDILDLKTEFNYIIDSTLNITERENRMIEYLQTHYPIFYYQIKHERLGEVKKYRVNNIHHSTIFKYQYSKFKIQNYSYINMRNSKEKNKELYSNLNRLGISIYVWYNWCKMRTTIPQYVIKRETEFLIKFLPKETLKYYNL